MAKLHPIDLRIAIMNAFDAQRLSGDYKPSDIAKETKAPLRATQSAMRSLGFEPIPGSQMWDTPREWPEEAKIQRQLKGCELNARQIKDAMQCNVPANYHQQSLRQLAQRGHTKLTVNRYQRELEEVLRLAEQNTISIAELALALKENPNANKIYLLNRVEGLIKYLNRSNK